MPKTIEKKSFYFARHGESQYNQLKLCAGSKIDSPLTEKGIQQACHLRTKIIDFRIDQVVSAVTLPVSVDIEVGFGKNDEEIVHNIKKVVSLGAVGINLEDGTGNDLFPITSIPDQMNKIQACSCIFGGWSQFHFYFWY